MDAHAQSNVCPGRLDSLGRALDLCLGVERDADAQAEIACLPGDPRGIADHLCVKRHAVAAGLAERSRNAARAARP